jgi:hypothetical protein
MTKYILSILISLLNQFFYCQDKINSERIYIFKAVAFNQEIEFYCTRKSIGYYKYPQLINDVTLYLTYEGNIFFKQSKFDENMVIYDTVYPANMWANTKGDVLNFRKKYAPVIDKNRKRKNYPFGFGKN